MKMKVLVTAATALVIAISAIGCSGQQAQTPAADEGASQTAPEETQETQEPEKTPEAPAQSTAEEAQESTSANPIAEYVGVYTAQDNENFNLLIEAADDADMVKGAGHIHVSGVAQLPGADALGQQQPALSVGLAVGIAVAGELVQEGLGHRLFLYQRHQRIPSGDPVGNGIQRHRLIVRRRSHGEARPQSVPERGGDDHAALGVNAVGIRPSKTKKWSGPSGFHGIFRIRWMLRFRVAPVGFFGRHEITPYFRHLFSTFVNAPPF